MKLIALAIVLASSNAFAQTIGVTVGGTNGTPGAAGAVSRQTGGTSRFQFQGLTAKVGLTASPSFSKAPALTAPGVAGAGVPLPLKIGSGLTAPKPAISAAAIPNFAAPEAITMVEGFSLPAVGEKAASMEAPRAGALGSLEKSVRPEGAKTSAVAPEWSLRKLFFGEAQRKDGSLSGPVVAAAPEASRGQVLARPALSQPTKSEPAVPAPAPAAKSRTFARASAAILFAAVLFLSSTIAAAAAAPAVATVASVGFLAQIHPLATAFASAAGAAYGLFAAKGKDGAAPSTGEALASALRYGLMAGGAAFVLLDLTQAVFTGFAAVAAKPLPFSMATAALGQGAFQGKFSDPATTSADRVMAAFPAVAAALGLSATAFLVPLALPFAAALTAMSVTGVAAAVFAALYKPGTSDPAGPARMAKGFVLQSLMSGLALSVSAPYLALPLAALGAWGFWSVVSTAAAEATAALPDSLRSLWRR